MKTQTKSGLPLYGAILGCDFVREEAFGKSVTRLVYILKSEKAPTVWQFYFYKPADKWFLGNVVFNDQFDALERATETGAGSFCSRVWIDGSRLLS